MKKFNFALGIFMLGMFASCGGGNTEPKEIEPTATEFQSGDLASYIELSGEPSQISYAEVDGVIPTQYIRLNVPVKLVKDGFEDVDPRDINFTGLFSVATLDLVDENGSKVQDLDIKKDDLLKLKKLLTQKAGATEVLVFEGVYHNSDDAPKWYASAVKYTPSLTADIQAGKPEVVPVAASDDDEDDDDTSVSTSTSSSSSSSSESASAEVEAAMQEFEAAYKEYADALKKMSSGDVTGVANMASYMAKYQSALQKLHELDDLTPADMARVNKAIAKAAEEISKLQ